MWILESYSQLIFSYTFLTDKAGLFASFSASSSSDDTIARRRFPLAFIGDVPFSLLHCDRSGEAALVPSLNLTLSNLMPLF